MEKSKPAISVLLPVHNGEDYLNECLDRIVNQSFSNFEIVAVNDASTDASLSILQNISSKDNRIKIITVEKQNSLADVLNIALKNAVGKYIVRIDHDDLMSQDRLEIQYKFMESHPEVVAAGGQIELIDEKGNKIGVRKYPHDDITLKRNIFLVSPFAHPAVIMQTEVVRKAGGYDTGLRKVEDVMLWFRLAKLGEFANVPETILSYRIRSNSESLADKYSHFVKTDAIRKKVVREKIYPITVKQRILMEIQKVVVKITRILPESWFMKIFEIGRKLILK